MIRLNVFAFAKLFHIMFSTKIVITMVDFSCDIKILQNFQHENEIFFSFANVRKDCVITARFLIKNLFARFLFEKKILNLPQHVKD